MGTVPDNYNWWNGEIPDFREMEARLTDMAMFLTNPPMVRLRRTTAQNIANTTATAIAWDFVEVETTNMWDAAQPTRITPSVPGWYVGSCGFSFSNNVTGYREMDVRKNGSATEKVIRIKIDAWATSTQTVTSRGHLFLEQFNGTTDYVETTLWQNSGVTLPVYVGALEQQPDFSLRWIAKL